MWQCLLNYPQVKFKWKSQIIYSPAYSKQTKET